MRSIQDFISSNESTILDFTVDSDTLLIAFGGIKGELGIPVFESFNLLGNVQVKKMFIRDIEQAWYQKGLPDKGIKTVEELLPFLGQKIKEANVKKTIMIGNSAGGFAVLLFGLLLKVDTVHAFAPQTFIDPKSRSRFQDLRWPAEIERLHSSPMLTSNYFNLYKLFFEHRKTRKPICRLYYDKTHHLDRIHSTRLGHFGHVLLHPYTSGGHGVIKMLKQDGTLTKIILDSI